MRTVWTFHLVSVEEDHHESSASLPSVFVVQITKPSLDGDGASAESVVRKHSVHLLRLWRHLKERFSDTPQMRVADNGNVDASDVETFLSFVNAQQVSGLLSVEDDAELKQFLHASTPRKDIWERSTPPGANAPKTRRVYVDVTLRGAVGLVNGVVESFFTVGSDPHRYFAVVTLGHQRYRTESTHSPEDCPTWSAELTFTAQSAAEWLEVTVMSLGGLMGAPLLVGVARVPIVSFISDSIDGAPAVDRELPLLDVRTAGVTGCVLLSVSAAILASRCHLARQGRGGTPLATFPVRVDTGDVWFFRTSKLLPSTTRLLTWSDWDHVGVVIGGKRLRMLESVSGSGVILRDLDTVMELYRSSCSEMGLRRFVANCRGETARPALVSERALRFAQEIRGLPYNYSVIDMITTSTEQRSQPQVCLHVPKEWRACCGIFFFAYFAERRPCFARSWWLRRSKRLSICRNL